MFTHALMLFLVLMLIVCPGFADPRSADVYAVQERLISLGLDPGEADGIYGKNTESAIMKYKQNNGLAPTSDIDDELKTHLKITNELLESAKQNIIRIKEETEMIRIPFNSSVDSNVEVKIISKNSNKSSSGSVWRQVTDDDVECIANGTIAKLIIESQNVPLKNNKVHSGIISTSSFGNLEYRFGLSGPKGIYGTRSQIKHIKGWLNNNK